MKSEKEIDIDVTLLCNDMKSYLIRTKSNFSKFYFTQASDQFTQSILPIIQKSEDKEQMLYNCTRKLLTIVTENCSFLTVRGPEDTPILKIEYIGILAQKLINGLENSSSMSLTSIKDCLTSAVFDIEHPSGIDIIENKDLMHYNMHENLVLLSKQGNIDSLKLLLKNDLDINYRNCLPIVKAAELGRTDVVKLLVEHNADITHNNYEALRLSIENRQMETVEYLISLKPERSLSILKRLTHTPEKMIKNLETFAEQYIENKEPKTKFTKFTP